jgi:predicted dehydrogenase
MNESTPVSRRRFVGQAALTAAATPWIASARALGRENRRAASDRLTLGFIGVGKQNLGHLGRYVGNPDVQVVAVCDVDTTRREEARSRVEKKYGDGQKSEYKGCATYNDFRELLARDDIDAVVIATPDHWHAIPVIEACKARKDIYCEKPLSLTIHEAKAMVDAVRKYDRVFQTGSQQRTEFKGFFRTACEYVRSGRIGQVLTVHVGIGGPSKWCDLPAEPVEPGLDWDTWLGPAPERPYNSILSPRGVHKHFPAWRDYREYSGGGYTDFGAHHYDIAQWGLDMDGSGPVEVIPPRDENARVGLRYRYANGVEMIHGGPSGVTFVGTKGIIQVDRQRLVSVPEAILEEPLGDKDVHLPQAANHHQDWLDCIKSRRRPIAEVEVGARSVTVCHLGNLAYWNRRTLRWDPQAWRFVGDDEANTWLDRDRRGPWQLPKI